MALLMTLECDGNAVNEEGWDKKLYFPETDKPGRSLENNSAQLAQCSYS